MKKYLLLLVVSLVLILAACGGNDGSENESSDDKEIVLRFNANFSELELDGAPAIASIKQFKEEVENKSDGRLKIDIFFDGQLGKSPSEVVGGAQSGAFEMFNLVSASWGEYTDAFLPLNIPYLITDADVGQEVLNGEIGQRMADKVLADTGVRIAYYRDQGFRHMTNNKQPIESPEDLQGLKMRVLNDPYTIDTYKNLGATTVSIAYSELYTSAQQGVIDGFDNLYPNILNAKLYEVQEYLSATKNGYTPIVVGIYDEVYQSLPKDLQNIFDEAAYNAQQRSEADDKYMEETIEELKKYVEFNELTPDQLKAFQDATTPVREKAREALGEEEWDQLIKDIEEIESNL